MKAETPEWKKEIAEKVKAYGERKKRLTTPPGPIKERDLEDPEDPESDPIELPKVPVFTKPALPEPVIIEKREPPVSEPVFKEPVVRNPVPEESVPHPSVEVWTEDLAGVTEEEDDDEESLLAEETQVTGGPYTLRRIVAGIIDHTILIVLWVVFVGGFSMVTKESMDSLIRNQWNVTLPVFLLFHFVYYLYFFRATRQTPGMVFLSLELRDPGSAVIPIGKILARWLCMILLNLFNFLPVMTGKRFLLMDHISATEMRSFK